MIAKADVHRHQADALHRISRQRPRTVYCGGMPLELAWTLQLQEKAGVRGQTLFD